MLSERLSTQPTNGTTVSDSFFLSMNQNQIRSTSVNGFSSHIGLSHRMFPFRIRCRGKQRPPKSEMLTASNWRMHWQSGVRVNTVQEVHHPMHNTSKEATNQHEKNNVVFTLVFPNDNWKSITAIVTLPSSFAEEHLQSTNTLLHNNSKFWMSEYSFVFSKNNCWFFTRYSLLFLRSKELIHTIIFRMLTLLMWNRTHRAHAAGRINIFSTLTMK